MAFKLPSMTRETTTTTGSGDRVLGGAVTGYLSYSAGLSDGDTTWATLKFGSDFEEGLYTFHAGANSLTPTTIYRSTNSNAALNLAGGTKDIACGFPGPSDIPSADLQTYLKLLGATVGYNVLANHTVSSGDSSYALTGITANDLIVAINPLAYAGSPSNVQIQIEFSTDGGSTWSAATGISAAISDNNSYYATVTLTGLQSGFVTATLVSNTTTQPSVANGLQVVAESIARETGMLFAGAAVNGVKIATSAGTWASGTINILGR